MRIIFNNKEDFEWYKKKLDVDRKYAHLHFGDPRQYPCEIWDSEFWDNPNGPREYHHSFLYQQEVICEKCGHKEFVWPNIGEE